MKLEDTFPNFKTYHKVAIIQCTAHSGTDIKTDI